MKWIPIEPRGNLPSARYGHSACLHTCMGSPKMLIFGGYRKIRLNDLFEYDTELQKWREIPMRGTFPGPRDCHSAVLFKDRYMIIFGGANGSVWLNDVFQYDILKEEWSLLVPRSIALPQGRAGHSAVLLGDDLIITAGWMGSRTLQDCWKFNLRSLLWTQVIYASVPPRPRDSHTSVIHFDKSGRPLLYIFGGGSSSKRHTGICIFDFETRKWSTHKSEYFLRLAGHDVIKTPDCKCIFFGGGDGVSWKRTLVQYDLKSDQWHKIKTSQRKEPPGAYGLSFVLYQVKHRLRAICWGGGNGDTFYSDLFELDLTHRYPMLMVRDYFCDCIVRTGDDMDAKDGFEQICRSLFVSGICGQRDTQQSSSSAPSSLITPPSSPRATAASVSSRTPQKPSVVIRQEPFLLP